MSSIIPWNKNTRLRLPAEIALEYQLLQPIGEGTYGKVFIAEHLRSRCRYALKVVSLLNTSEGVPPTTMREMAFLKNFEHPNIVKLHQIYLGLESVAFVFELCSTDLGHTLDAQIKAQTYLPRGYVRCVMRQLVTALDAVHAQNILHRDIKPQNVLLNHAEGSAEAMPDVVKLADFGLSVMYGLSLPHEQKYCTAITLWYRPPELLLGEIYYNVESEVWSLGCLFLELLLTHNIFNGNNECQQLRLIFSLLDLPFDAAESLTMEQKLSALSLVFKDVDFKLLRFLHGPISHSKSRLKYYLPYMVDPVTQDLVLKMLCLNPDKRITISEILRHAYFAAEAAAHDITPTIAPSRFVHVTQALVPKVTSDDVLEPVSPEYIYEENLIRLANEAIARDYRP